MKISTLCRFSTGVGFQELDERLELVVVPGLELLQFVEKRGQLVQIVAGVFEDFVNVVLFGVDELRYPRAFPAKRGLRRRLLRLRRRTIRIAARGRSRSIRRFAASSDPAGAFRRASCCASSTTPAVSPSRRLQDCSKACGRTLEPLEELRADQGANLLLAVLFTGIDGLVVARVIGQGIVDAQHEERLFLAEGAIDEFEQSCRRSS